MGQGLWECGGWGAVYIPSQGDGRGLTARLVGADGTAWTLYGIDGADERGHGECPTIWASVPKARQDSNLQSFR